MEKLLTLNLCLKNVVKPIRKIIARFHWDHWCVNWLGRLLSLVRWSFGETSISHFRTGLVRWRADPHLLSSFPAMTIGLSKWRDGRKPTDIVFLDFSTPSDSVPHKRLLFKQERQLALTAVFFSTCSHLFNWRHAAIRPAWYMLVMVSYFIGSTQGNNSRTVGISVICFLLKPTSIRRTHPIKRTRTPKWMLFWQFIYCFKPLFSGHLNKPRKGHLFRLQVYERVGISLVEVCMYERVGKSVIWVC